MRVYHKKSNRPHKPLVLWTVQMLDQLSILLTHQLCQTKNTYLLANDRLSDIATDKYVEAFELLYDCVSILQKFECGTGTIPSCPLLQADKAKLVKAKLEKAPKCTAGVDTTSAGFITPDAKGARPGKSGDAAPSADDLSGTLVYTGADMMLTVNEANPSLHLCMRRQRVGCNCPRGSSCLMIHDLDISKWPDATFAKWSVLIKKTPGLEWNGKVANPAKVTARISKLSASSLASAVAGKAKA
jgi:hypothetical protein